MSKLTRRMPREHGRESLFGGPGQPQTGAREGGLTRSLTRKPREHDPFLFALSLLLSPPPPSWGERGEGGAGRRGLEGGSRGWEEGT